MNKYPLIKNIILIVVLLIAALYAVPNIFPEHPAIQISSITAGQPLSPADIQTVQSILDSNHVVYKSLGVENKNLVIQFVDPDTQLQAKAFLKDQLSDQYIVALNLESSTPKWLMALGAYPLKLGLDLRGGVNFLLQVDMDSVFERHQKGDIKNISEILREQRIRYLGLTPLKMGSINISFRDRLELKKAYAVLQEHFPNFAWKIIPTEKAGNALEQLNGQLLPAAIQEVRQYAIKQTQSTLSRRVNELGVAEAIVQQEGIDRISVDLPGIQDAARAKDIIGKIANLEFHLVDTKNDAADAAANIAPAGDELQIYNKTPVLLFSRIVLSGDSITTATASFDQSGRPSVNIRLGGGGESYFSRITGENIGQPMAVVYIETKPTPVTQADGSVKIEYKQEKRVINIATIQSALGMNFEITGLSSPEESRNLALLLRAGTLPAPSTIIQERTVGPSMGRENIRLGMWSLIVGMLIIVVFMMIYYELFGLIANIGLIINLIFLLAILSALGAVLTFPGIAGLVLTIGMAVDYNVLIYERIREELRQGISPQAAIHTGYDKAFTTIIDANLVSLIVALILFALGSGPVKGFAIIMTIGLFTSIISSVTYTRALVNWIYGGRRVNRLLIGIKPKRVHDHRQQVFPSSTSNKQEG